MSVVTLDEEQRDAAHVDPSVKQVVIASAGSGKTETVAELVAHLVDQGLDGSQEILVLSFSRAAVAAVRRRFTAKDLGGVNIRTLDGLAARVISSVTDDEPASDFDGRIRQATKLLQEGGIPEELQAVSHVVVDEIQDVVGDRAKFVLAILNAVRAHAGFTLLGDPQQAIYNFQLSGPSDVTSPSFLKMVDTAYAPRLIELLGEYRAIDDDARRVTELSRRLTSLHGASRTNAVRSAVAEAFVLTGFDDLLASIDGWEGTTAVLCVNNGTAMRVHSALRDAGVASVLQSSAEQRGVAGWVADSVKGRTKLSRADFEQEWDGYEVGLGAADAWRLLKRAERKFATPKSLEVSRLSTAIALRDVPADLLEPPSARVVVSTVHRSKGLEFDNVVLVNAGSWLPATCTDDDVSVAYVALSRARRRIFSLQFGVDKQVWTDKPSGRWCRGGYKRWQTFGFEIQPGDFRAPSDPARSFEIQEYLRGVIAGEPVEMRRDPSMPDDTPRFDLVHEGQVIGRTTEQFGAVLRRRCRTGVPARMVGLRIGGYESRGCGPELQSPKVATVWRAPIVSGLASLEWESK